ncbi:MAG TPA: lipid A biosynthesis acyltransferase [Deltaproteobacteria bacterium]|nr:lipid A biosynthesis acyltransferase [Deltaproteobacteria bacterium]
MASLPIVHDGFGSLVPATTEGPIDARSFVMTASDVVGDGASQAPWRGRSRQLDREVGLDVRANRTAALEADGKGAGWLTQRERGAVWLIRLTAFWVGVLGRRPLRIVVCGIAAYYALFDRVARSASRHWLERVHGREPRLSDIYRHIRCFAQVTLDRLLFVAGRTSGIEIGRTGTGALDEQVKTGRGAFLLGAHLGSMDAMRAEGQEKRLPVSVVGHFENARMINAVLEGLNPELSSRVIHAGQDPVRLALTLQERIAEGGLVAITADRIGLNEKFVEVDFFGAPAAFATGPFILASVLKCPIYLVFGLYFEPNRYELFSELFADRIELPRRGRQEALEEIVRRYAARLESYCRLAPDNWFNFFDFWESGKR